MNRDRPVERDAVISVDGIHFQYDSHPLFHDLSLTVRESEFLSVIGPNGSGKSTLLKLILGIMKPSKGRIAVFGKDIGKMKRKAISQLVSGVLLDFNPAYSFSVEEIVAIGRTPYAKAFSDFTREDRIAIEEALEKTSLLTLRKKPFEHLSSGERQRVLLAKCLAQKTPILLLDECVAHLDPGHVQQFLEVVRDKNRKEKITVVTVFHDINLASLYSDRIVVVDQGKLSQTGDPVEIVHQRLLENVYRAQATVLTHPRFDVPQVLLNRLDRPQTPAPDLIHNELPKSKIL
ncbi:MAG: ABC transporter ATP-binding protein [Thermotogota bacterium]